MNNMQQQLNDILSWVITTQQLHIARLQREMKVLEVDLGGMSVEFVHTGEVIPDWGSADIWSDAHAASPIALRQLLRDLADIDIQLSLHREKLLHMTNEARGLEGIQVAANNLLEASQLLGLAQSTLASFLLKMSNENIYVKQRMLYGIRLYLERIDTALSWAIEALANVLQTVRYVREW